MSVNSLWNVLGLCKAHKSFSGPLCILFMDSAVYILLTKYRGGMMVILVSVWTLVFIWCHKIIIKWAPWGFGSCIHFTFRVTNIILKTTVIKTHLLTCFTNSYSSYCNFNFKTTECWQTIYLLCDTCNDTRKGLFTSGLLNYIFLRARLFNWKFGGGQIFLK